jgi:hypothetical protein
MASEQKFLIPIFCMEHVPSQVRLNLDIGIEPSGLILMIGAK